MTSPARTISRAGVVRTAGEGCVTIDVGVPCVGCRQVGCAVRQPARPLKLAASELKPGERVRLALGADRLTRVSMALYGPPLIWLVFSGWLVSGATPGPAVATVLAGVTGIVGLLLTLILGAALGRQQVGRLEIDVIPMKSLPGEASEV
jgi:positive regulator of sigma E activity